MEDMKQTMSQMFKSLGERMTYFEAGLQKATPATSAALGAEYGEFKEFTLLALRTMQRQIELLSQEVDQLEMRGRRKILLLHGVTEKPQENIVEVVANTVSDHLKLSGFSVADISHCHGMGRSAKADRPRPILLKLKDMSIRSKLWSAKSKLKGSGITVSEFLTKTRHDVFLVARERFGVAKCWTMEGTIYVLGADGTRHRVRSLEELNAIDIQNQKATKKVEADRRPKRAATTKKS